MWRGLDASKPRPCHQQQHLVRGPLMMVHKGAYTGVEQLAWLLEAVVMLCCTS
jgi:hypothetical protein